MNIRNLSQALAIIAVLLFASIFCPTVYAQGALPESPTPSTAPVASNAFIEPITTRPQTSETHHKFWDNENRVLFLTSAALSGADFAVTRANLQSGGTEMNPIVRLFGTSTAGLAANFAGETMGVVGFSYFFHKTGHHKLERAVSMVNIGCSAGAVAYGMTHRGVRVTARF